MNEIEEKFYKTFEIKYTPYYDCNLSDTIKPKEVFPLRDCSKGEIISFCKDKENYKYCKITKVKKYYPPITDRILLELICIYSQRKRFILSKDNYFSLKERLLKNLIEFSDDNWIKVQVQSLFTEGEE